MRGATCWGREPGAPPVEGGAQESRYEVVETELISSVEVGNSDTIGSASTT